MKILTSDQYAQKRYRIRYDPTRWFFRYIVEELYFWKDVTSEGGVIEVYHIRRWRELGSYCRYAGASVVWDNLRLINGNTVAQPQWYDKRRERP